jgi:hypothetical protein
VVTSAVLGAKVMEAEGVMRITPSRAVLGAKVIKAEGVILITPSASRCWS